MRNGDFTPTRLQCQQEAANLIMQCKLRANPENAVGILSMAELVFILLPLASFRLSALRVVTNITPSLRLQFRFGNKSFISYEGKFLIRSLA
uniref:VWFA domain-containing protein n=1 Tax=Parascaris equorum TaxID=6256 RepID=A0A914R205_PAREQ